LTFGRGEKLAKAKRVEAGKIESAIDRIYPLERIAGAHGYVDKGQKKKEYSYNSGI